MDAKPFVDIHCHLAPGIDDGAKSWEQTLDMAKMAVADGLKAIICTPHQLGFYEHNSGTLIRETVQQVQRFLDDHGVPLQVRPGADVRIAPEMFDKLQAGDVLSLADQRKHVLLELPHELYFPIESVLDRLHQAGMVGVLSHPERNQGIIKQPHVLEPLVRNGCLMQVTCGSLAGTFGPQSRRLAESMVSDGLVHFLATDAHGSQARRPLMQRAFERVAALTDQETALTLCCENPLAVFEGRDVAGGVRTVARRKSTLSRLLSWGRAA